MKNLLVLFLAFLFVANANAQTIYTELRDGVIDKDYDSFSLLDPTKKAEPNTKEAVIISDDYMTSIVTYTDPDFPSQDVKKQVEHAIKHELITDDYKHKKSGGEMLVSYLVFGREGTLKGDFTDDDELIGIDRAEEHDVKKGTLLISVIDKESGRTVWSGFSDGAFSSETPMDDNKVIKVVSDILDRLRLER
ncbi:DUF4136 domain-containing protein [Marivirga sp. S37H4]|uniref:DUF4136 domain-containing protein n=1 Tax=Marivirga aurantiaca TaxID=2802615 RepID=A0A934WX11_9BACT|nr:DUF4136 domain-containing protein [Marivirga aurantiaca]MBK6264472.1 DUF4136 domain-containing protein [Marivirga aurantiaca]